jgi:hypothetical protein
LKVNGSSPEEDGYKVMPEKVGIPGHIARMPITGGRGGDLRSLVGHHLDGVRINLLKIHAGGFELDAVLSTPWLKCILSPACTAVPTTFFKWTDICDTPLAKEYRERGFRMQAFISVMKSQ